MELVEAGWTCCCIAYWPPVKKLAMQVQIMHSELWLSLWLVWPVTPNFTAPARIHLKMILCLFWKTFFGYCTACVHISLARHVRRLKSSVLLAEGHGKEKKFLRSNFRRAVASARFGINAQQKLPNMTLIHLQKNDLQENSKQRLGNRSVPCLVVDVHKLAVRGKNGRVYMQNGAL